MTQVATCLTDGAPLVSTIAFRYAEFYCLECGTSTGIFGPAVKGEDETPELLAKMEAATAEWVTLADGLIPEGGRLKDCSCCEKGEDHVVHARESELEAHDAARRRLDERVRRA